MSYLYTHHQKTVVLDAPALNDPSKRRLVGFVGGLDLTNGRSVWFCPRGNCFWSQRPRSVCNIQRDVFNSKSKPCKYTAACRYDTPNHNLFRGLGTTWYQADFHQPNIADGSVTYPAGMLPHYVQSQRQGDGGCAT
jgi:hypothetical protein